MNDYLTLDTATERGKRAFIAGIKAVPHLDTGFTTEACASDVPTAHLLDAWSLGWTRENLKWFRVLCGRGL